MTNVGGDYSDTVTVACDQGYHTDLDNHTRVYTATCWDSPEPGDMHVQQSVLGAGYWRELKHCVGKY